MSRETVHSQSYATFFRHSAVLSLPAVLLRKLANDNGNGNNGNYNDDGNGNDDDNYNDNDNDNDNDNKIK